MVSKSKRFLLLLGVGFFLQSCYLLNFFNRKHNADEGGGDASEVLGDNLGAKAGGRDEAALASVYAVPSVKSPAAVRPDPDVFARRLLRQFRAEGTTLARVIGDVENYRVLLGGATLDFSTAPANGYDATSVLATMKVAEEICKALVSPNSWQHPGWSTILPNPVTDVRSNLVFLVQRISGIKSSEVSEQKISQLELILTNAQGSDDLSAEAYVDPCTAVVLDAQAMLM